MSTKKAIITRLTFSIFLLTIFSLVTANVKNITVDGIVSNTVHFFQDETNSQISKDFIIVPESNDDSVTISEKEIEIELEVEPHSFVEDFSYLFLQNLHLSNKTYFTTSLITKQTIPLYDLFCSWKFHLS